MLTIIVAMDKKNGIGYQGKLPWHLKNELKHFKEVTYGHLLIMGETTYRGIGRPLPGREMLIATKDPDYHPQGVLITDDLEITLKKYAKVKDEVFICGGKSIYDQAIPYAKRLLISRIKGDYLTDTDFPDYNKAEFELIKSEEYEEFTVEEYLRKGEIRCEKQ